MWAGCRHPAKTPSVLLGETKNPVRLRGRYQVGFFVSPRRTNRFAFSPCPLRPLRLIIRTVEIPRPARNDKLMRSAINALHQGRSMLISGQSASAFSRLIRGKDRSVSENKIRMSAVGVLSRGGAPCPQEPDLRRSAFEVRRLAAGVGSSATPRISRAHALVSIS